MAVVKDLLAPKALTVIPPASPGDLQEPLIESVSSQTSPVLNRASIARATSLMREYVEELATSKPFDLTPELLLGEARHEVVRSLTMRLNHVSPFPLANFPPFEFKPNP
jgi:hypothetical protein